MLNEAERKIVDCVEKYGWFALSVAPAANSDDPEEWFTYTIGLQKTHGWPEMICFGLDGTTAHGVIADAIAECEAKGVCPTAGMELTETLANGSAKLVENADIPFNYLGSANWFAAYSGMSDPPEKLQLLWPDKNGYFPDDARCNPEVRRLQTPIEVA